MNHGPLLFLGIFLSFALSWAGMVFLPVNQLGRQDMVEPFGGEGLYPRERAGLADQGKQIYRSEGCAACHTQQVRPQDVPQWGLRFTVAQDYLRDEPVMFGSLRLGPDLANVGARLPDANWHLVHLYDPKAVVARSPMPKYEYLFEKREIRGEKSPSALRFPPEYDRVEEGSEIIPTQQAIALVAYLQSLRADVPLRESPLPKPPETAEESAEGAAPTNNNSPAQ